MSKLVPDLKPPKRKLLRDPSAGTFEAPSPLNDPAILDQAVRWVRAIDELLPIFEHVVAGLVDANSAKINEALALVLSTYKKSILDQLALADDKEFLKSAKNPVLRAARRFVSKPDTLTLQVKGGDAH